MSYVAPDIRNILERVPGKLAINCTDLSLPYPHGGTALGSVADAFVTASQPVQYVTAEEWGVEVEDFQPGDEYRHVFGTPGTYLYYCSIHGTTTVGMVGSVTVLPADG